MCMQYAVFQNDFKTDEHFGPLGTLVFNWLYVADKTIPKQRNSTRVYGPVIIVNEDNNGIVGFTLMDFDGLRPHREHTPTIGAHDATTQ